VSDFFQCVKTKQKNEKEITKKTRERMMKNLFKYGLVVLAVIVSTGLLWADQYVELDTTETNRCDQEKIISAKVEGEMDITIQDSIDIHLSHIPTIEVKQEENNFSLWVAIAAILANIAMTIATIIMQVRMQKKETKELYIRKMQEISIDKQGDLYHKLVSLEDFVSSYDEWPTNDNHSLGMVPGTFYRQLKEATEFLNINKAYIRGEKERLASDILDKYKNPPQNPKSVMAQKERMDLINRFAKLMQKP